MKMKEKINLPVDTQVLCVPHKCLAWGPQAWAGERGGDGGGVWGWGPVGVFGVGKVLYCLSHCLCRREKSPDVHAPSVL